MRIFYVIDSLKIGGAEMLLLAMVRRYLRLDHQIQVAYFSEGPLHDELTELGVPVHRISRRGLADPRALFRLLALLRRERPEVVHTHLRKSDLLGQPAAAIAGTRVRVSSIHNEDPWRRNKLLTLIHRVCTGRCQKVIAVSREAGEFLVETGTYPAEKIVSIDNGIDLERFDPERVVPADKTTLWGLEPGDPAIGIVGRLEPQKGHHVLLEAAAIVVREMPGARFVIVGDGPLRPELEAQRARLGLEEHVVFAGISRDVPATLAALDVVVSSSLWEGLPLTLLEAMAMAKPLVCTAVGGVRSLLEDGRTGVVVAPGDPEALSRGLLRLLGDPREAARLGARAAATVRESYSEETMHERILDVYRSLQTGEARECV